MIETYAHNKPNDFPLIGNLKQLTLPRDRVGFMMIVLEKYSVFSNHDVIKRNNINM